MPRKLILILLIALSFYACGNKSGNNVRTLDESFTLLKEYIEDSTMSFDEYQPIFEEILDSLQDAVLHNPDANERFTSRTLPAYMLTHICNSEPENKRDSILNLYNLRRRDILYTWYAQQMIDSTDNKPYIIISYAAPYDVDGNDTRVSFTFSENCNKESEPVMIVVLPVKAENPLILFSEWDEDGIEHSSNSYILANNNIMVYADTCQTHIMLMGDFLNDMLEYEQMNVCYIREDTPEGSYKQNITAIPVELYQFQRQYKVAHQWMLGNK